MLLDYQNGQTGVILRVKIVNSSLSTGGGLTGLTSSSTGLRISTIADNEATATSYTAAGSTIDTIATLGTFATPTSAHCRFKEVDATNHPGVYELQIDNARFAVSNAKSLLVSVTGATNASECDAVIPLRAVNPYDGVRGGMTSMPPTALYSTGTVTDGSPSTTGFTPSLANPANYAHMAIQFYGSAANAGLSNEITGASGGKFTFANAWPVTPVNGDTFLVLGFVK